MTDGCRTVLVVDDDPDILEIVTAILELHGVPTVTASDGVEALAVMRDSHGLGLVLLDLMMPRMNGVDVLAEMKRDPELSTIAVVLISGNYRTEQAVLGMGANEYLLKPLDVNVLMRAVSRFVPVPGMAPQAEDERLANPTI
jgi:CheY-like chemotaxis protein